MGERCNRTAEVRGSIPLGSTNEFKDLPTSLENPNLLDTHRAHTGTVKHGNAALRAVTRVSKDSGTSVTLCAE